MVFVGAQFTQTGVIRENHLKTANLDYGNLNASSLDLPKINLQEIDDRYYNSGPEMLIVAPNDPDFVEALEPLAKWKNEKGVKTLIVSNFSLYEGNDTAEKIRNMIKDYYSKGDLEWVLLAADAQDNLIPTRYVYNPDTVRYEQPESVGDRYLKPTDYYYADLTGDWDEDGDGQYGESANDNANEIDEISWIPEVYVGRLPASDATELEIMVNKTINYEKNPFIDNWMNRTLFAAGMSDLPSDKDPDGEDEARLSHFIWENHFPSDMNSTHLTQTTDFYPPGIPKYLRRSSFTSEFNKGYSTVFAAGHGNYGLINDQLETFFTNDDAKNAANQYMPSLFYADACT
ncbi:MAG: C25 family cysteine peptidase, partial [Promethearchaeota archaeon]